MSDLTKASYADAIDLRCECRYSTYIGVNDEFYSEYGELIILECPHCGTNHKFKLSYPSNHLPAPVPTGKKPELVLVKETKYNHAYTIAFSLSSINEGEKVTEPEIIEALKKRIKELEGLYNTGDGQIIEAVGLPFDTYEED